MGVNVTEGDFMKRRISLPTSVKSTGPGITDHMLLASISTHLHLSKDPASGQSTSPSLIEKNPTAYINPAQPLMCAVSVSEEETKAQQLVSLSPPFLPQEAVEASWKREETETTLPRTFLWRRPHQIVRAFFITNRLMRLLWLNYLLV